MIVNKFDIGTTVTNFGASLVTSRDLRSFIRIATASLHEITSAKFRLSSEQLFISK